MGQQCEKICYQPNLTPTSQASQSYLKLMQSVQIDEKFPIETIPETVMEKIRLLNLKVDFNRSELWKYHQPKSDSSERPYMIYTLIHHEDILKSVEPEKVIVATSQSSLRQSQGQQKLDKANAFNAQRFNQASIFLFRQNGLAHNQINPYAEDSRQNLEFEQFYYGPINQKMSQPNGIKIFKTGEYYQGNIEDNCMQGQGIMMNSLGNHSYNGTWSKNKPQGHGVQELDKQFNFDGNFVSGKWNGPGKLTLLNLANPIHLEGNFIYGNLEGHGTIRNQLNEIVFEGDFKNGKEHGKGTWYGPNNDKYEGDFVQGMKQGRGKFTFGSGNVYQGSFKNGHPQGEGILIKDGITTRGHWFNGENILAIKDENDNEQ